MENKYIEIQLTKNKMDLNNRKMTNHPPSPVTINIIITEVTQHFKPVQTKTINSK